MQDSIRDDHNKGLISFKKEDLIQEAIKNPDNQPKISLALAHSVVDRRLGVLDFLDFYLMFREPMN